MSNTGVQINIERYDELIKDLYTKKTEKGSVKRFCEKYDLKHHHVRRRALALGVVQSCKKEPPWTDEEIELLSKYHYKNPINISAILRRRGFRRTPTAIEVKRKRLELYIRDADIYSASGLASVMGVDIKVITRYINRGLLNASRRGTGRSEEQGDIWLIKPGAVKKFIKENAAVVDIRKCDKYWLIDLLTN